MVAKNAPIPLKLAAMLQNVSVCIQFEAKDRDFIQYILYRLLKIRQILRLFYLKSLKYLPGTILRTVDLLVFYFDIHFNNSTTVSQCT